MKLEARCTPQTHDREAQLFAAVVRSHARHIRLLLLRQRVAAHDVDDLAQEIFFAAYAQLHTFQGRASIRAWLSGICRNKANDYHRAAKRVRGLHAAYAWLGEPAGTDPFAELLRNETASRVRRSLSRLPDAQRAVLILHEFEDIPMRTVAMRLGCRFFTAYTRHRSGCHRLRAYLKREELAEFCRQPSRIKTMPTQEFRSARRRRVFSTEQHFA